MLRASKDVTEHKLEDNHLQGDQVRMHWEGQMQVKTQIGLSRNFGQTLEILPPQITRPDMGYTNTT